MERRQVRAGARGRRSRARHAARRRRRRLRHAGPVRDPPARPGARARRGLGQHHTVRARRAAGVVARDRSGCDGRERQHVLHRRPRPRARALHRADGVRPHRRRSGVRGAHRAVVRAAATRGPLDARGRPHREHGEPRSLPADAVPGLPPRGQHRTHTRDLADQGRLRVVRVARGQGTRPELGADRGAGRPSRAGLDRFQPEHGLRRRAEGDRGRGRRVFRGAHDAGAVRARVRDERDARPDQLPS